MFTPQFLTFFRCTDNRENFAALLAIAAVAFTVHALASPAAALSGCASRDPGHALDLRHGVRADVDGLVALGLKREMPVSIVDTPAGSVACPWLVGMVHRMLP